MENAKLRQAASSFISNRNSFSHWRSLMANSNGSVSQLVDHFVNSTGETLVRLQSAVSSGDTSGIKVAFEKIKDNALTQHIATMIASSKSKRDEFIAMASETGSFGKVVIDLTITAAGAILYGGAAGIAEAIAGAAMAAALTELLVVVGFALMAIGIFMIGKELYKRLKQTADDAFNHASTSN
jgi:VIT1/CCC1 family predicted Fe2+/Mn2+ transporter